MTVYATGDVPRRNRKPVHYGILVDDDYGRPQPPLVGRAVGTHPPNMWGELPGPPRLGVVGVHSGEKKDVDEHLTPDPL